MKNMIKNLSVRITLAAVILAILLVSATSAVYAVPGINVKNNLINLTLSPGQHSVQTISITNVSTTEALDMQVEVDGLGQGADGSSIALVASQDTSPFSARNFITSIDVTSFHLEPNDVQVINATITVPDGTAPGERYAAIYIYSGVITSDKVGMRVASIIPVIITIPGFTPDKTGQITGIQMTPTNADEQVQIQSYFKNIGNCRIDTARMTMTLTDSGGAQLVQNVSKLASPSILPTFTRTFTMNYSQGLSVGKYNVKAELRLGDGTILSSSTSTFNITAATATITSSTTTTATTKTVSTTKTTGANPTTTATAPADNSTIASIPGIDPTTITITRFLPGQILYVDAKNTASSQVYLKGVTGAGVVSIGAYTSEPQVAIPFSAGIIKGGTGKPYIKAVDAQVSGYNSGDAEITIYYANDEVNGFDLNSLFLGYCYQGTWHICSNLVLSPDSNSVTADIPIIRLTGTPVALGGTLIENTMVAPPVTNSQGGNTQVGISWSMVALIVSPIIVLGGIAALVMREKRKQTSR